jgi:hypothetical protein
MSDPRYVMGDVGRCATCGGAFVVKKDGTMRWHLGNSRIDGSTRWRRVCVGVGKPPEGPATGGIITGPPIVLVGETGAEAVETTGAEQ